MDLSQELAQQLLEQSPLHIHAKDSDLKLLYCNQAVADTFGATPESMVGTRDTRSISAGLEGYAERMQPQPKG
ncbi:MAG: PAS domain-containing protein [Cyanobacteria bacterium J06638_7]